MAKDYYKVLGVDEKAGKDEIKKKYRELAKKYHPDRNKGNKQAEEKFKDISEAYDILKDDQKRQQYDNVRRFGGFGAGQRPGGFPGGGQFYTDADFSKAFGGQFNVEDLFGFGGLGDLFSSVFGGDVRSRRCGSPFGFDSSAPQRGKDLRAELKITFLQSLNGVTKKIRLSVPEACSACGGSGAVAGENQRVCSRCGGTGQIVHTQGNFSISRPCPSCLGRGVTQGENCSVCRGKGVVSKRKMISIKIPAGIENGGMVRLRGLGYPGRNGGEKGDLIIEVKVMEHQQFKREGNDIQTAVDISFPQAALGAKVPVKALTKKVMLTVPAGTQPGTVLRLKGAGLAVGDKGGDMLVKINVVVPTSLTTHQRELLKEFEEAGK